MAAQIEVRSFNFALTAGGSPLQLLPNNPLRRYFIVCFTQVNALSVPILTSASDGLLETAFYATSAVATETFLRQFFGPLATGEVWISDGNGGSPTCKVTITEGCDIPSNKLAPLPDAAPAVGLAASLLRQA